MLKLRASSLTLLALLGFFFFIKNLEAAPGRGSWAQYLESEIDQLDSAVQSVPAETRAVAVEEGADLYFFRRFWLRIRARIERDIPGLAGFAVIPEVELLWERPNPNGWENYKVEKQKNH